MSEEARCIGLRLAAARRERRIAVADAAKVAAMGRSTLYATEQGRRDVTLVEAAALARLYRISLDQVVRECCSGGNHLGVVR